VTEERLQDLSLDALYVLAEKLGLNLPQGLEHVFILSEILDAFTEDNDERRIASSTAVHVEEKKFSGSELDEIDASLDLAPCIVARYNETRIHVLVRDPGWAFVFWDVRDEDLDSLCMGEGSALFFLRVVENPFVDAKNDVSFDLAVGKNDNSWYIHLPEPDMDYRIDLYVRCGQKIKLLAHSETVRTPRLQIAKRLDPVDSVQSEIMLLSGIEDLEPPSRKEHHPSRIMGNFDA